MEREVLFSDGDEYKMMSWNTLRVLKVINWHFDFLVRAYAFLALCKHDPFITP